MSNAHLVSRMLKMVVAVCAVRASAKPERKTGSLGWMNKANPGFNAWVHVELMGHSRSQTPFLHGARTLSLDTLLSYT